MGLRRAGSKKRANERGSELIEFALISTVLFMLIFGIMDFSRAVYAYHWTSYVAREATRYASVHGSTYPASCPNGPPFVPTNNCQVKSSNTVNVTSYVQSLAQSINLNGLTTGPGGLTVATTWPGVTANPTGCNTAKGTNSPGCPVKVVVTYIYGFTLPFVTNTLSTVSMTSTSQVVIAQ